MIDEHDWLTPAPFWSSNGFRQAEFYRPALFEFCSDDFMEEFLAAAAASNPTALQAARLSPPEDNSLNQLFQPIHGCFYLAAASLCCRQPGFPERELRPADGETVSFVLRKLVGKNEYGWVVQGQTKLWKPVKNTGRVVLDGEERLPLVPVPLSGGRSIHCGYVPVSSSQMYSIPPAELNVNGLAPLNVRIEELDSRFTSPLKRNQGEGDPHPTKNLVDDFSDDSAAWTMSVYLVVELWEFLQSYLPDVATAIKNSPVSPQFSGDKAKEMSELLTFLNNQAYKGSLSLADALKAVALHYKELNEPGGGDLDALGFTPTAYSLKNSVDLSDQALEDLKTHVAAALPGQDLRVKIPKLDVSMKVHYVLRFVFERPKCEPAIVEVSLPSQPFIFAPVYDPDAPARSVIIPLPSDISIAGMRKFKKNVTFIMSDAMRRKMQSLLGKEHDILKDPDTTLVEDTDSPAFAFICSFSLQIIFMVAFMLLLMFVVVFNIMFWWQAFFKICLPVPKDLLPE